MAKEIALRFTYDALPADTKGKLIRLSAQIKHSAADHVAKIIEIGELVAAAHDLLATAGCEGKFRNWVEAECSFSERTARNYRDAFLRFGGNVATIATFTPSAIYALSAPSAPQDAIDVAFKIAKKGKSLDEKQAKAIIAKFRKKQEAKGDAYEPIEEVRVEEPAKPAKPPKAGKAVGEGKAALFKALRDAIGSLSKATDALAEKYGKHTHYKVINRHADEIDKSAKQWEEDVRP